MDKLVIKNLHKSYGDNHVLRGIDLTLSKGESFAVIGGSGSGKSVLLRCVLGLETPDSGSVEIDGVDMTYVSAMKRENIGTLFQYSALFDSLTIWENVSFALLHKEKMPRPEAYGRAIDLLAKVGLGEKIAPLYPSELSGGMKKRVGLARALAANPDFVLFDEPNAGLDPISADKINELIISTCRNTGASVLTITHDMQSVRKIADRAAMLYQGKFIWQGAASDMDESGNPYVAQFVAGAAQGPIDHG